MTSSTAGACPAGCDCQVCRRRAVIAAVAAADGSLSRAQVAAAVDAVVGHRAVLASLWQTLVIEAGALQAGAPPAVGRLVTALIAAGSAELTPPRCVDCGATGRPLSRVESGGVCRRCQERRGARRCAHCQAVKRVAARTPAGEPLCEPCRRHLRGRRVCGVCGQLAAIACRARGGQPEVCVNCYRLPEAVCAWCDRRRPCHFAESDRPCCKACEPRPLVACARCGAERPVTARWPEGPVCEACYRSALSHRGTCVDCGAKRRLVSPAGPDASRCGDCAGVATPGSHTCEDCGLEDRLFERGRCVRCTLRRRTHQLLADDSGDVPAALEPVAVAIANTRQPYSAVNWLRSGAGASLLADLAAGRLPATHEALDALPRPRAADYLRRLLVAHDVLADRNEALARCERWLAELLAAIDSDADRRLLQTYATWRVLRRLRRRAEQRPGPHTPTANARLQLKAAAGLLAWLADRDLTLAEAGQADIDSWLATGPSAYHVRDFLGWTAEHGHSPHLAVPTTAHRAGTALAADTRWELLARLLHDADLALTDRVAGSLLLCYAQPLSRLTAMTADQVTRQSDATTTIRFASCPITVPQPLAGLLRAHLDTPRPYTGVGSPAISPWLFPGHLPGRPLTAAHLSSRLRTLGIDARAARRAALIHLAAELPAAVLADLLHLSPGAAVRWVNTAGGDWSRYAAALASQPPHHPDE